MRLSWSRTYTVARREFLYGVTRKSFILTVIGMPLYFAFIFWIAIGPQIGERVKALKSFSSLGVVDSSGLFAGAETEITSRMAQNVFSRGAAPRQYRSFRTQVRFFGGLEEAEAALRAGKLSQVLVIPRDYLEHGRARRYARKSSLFGDLDERSVGRWLTRNLVRGHMDSVSAERAVRPTESMEVLTLSRAGRFEAHNDLADVAGLLVPLAIALILGLSILIGGQYLLQGLGEEKESRILESMLCTVSAEELLAGKMVGLGGVGLAQVGIWLGTAALFGAAAASVLPVKIEPGTLLLAGAYFIAGYAFYASVMAGIGSVASSAREAQQISVAAAFGNFIPLMLLEPILEHPDSALAVTLSLLPPTAPVAMMLRMAAPGSAVPAWQVAASLLILAGTAWMTLKVAARIFRVGMLAYGKTPNLAEVWRWMRRA